jgi:DNA-directed RNA polymerase I subunit RPA1
MLTSKDTFIKKELFMQLVYISTWQCLTKPSHKIVMPKPALYKPQHLFTGKQLISTILKTLVSCEMNQEADQKKGLYMDKGSKIPADIFGISAKDESMLYV